MFKKTLLFLLLHRWMRFEGTTTKIAI